MLSNQFTSRVSLRGLALTLVFLARGSCAAPCDIYASGGTPCVAAHSSTRALYSAYNGSLYQVMRVSDGATTNVSPLSPGDVANAATQDNFCAGTICVIPIIYDQSGTGNHLTQAPPGTASNGPDVNGYDNVASAEGAPVTLNGQKAYGVFISPGTGYRNNAAVGTATGDAAEGMYYVVDGTHYNAACCFDYGNAEKNNNDPGNGHMEAVYFGALPNGGAGSGPWVMADLENGLFAGASRTSDPSDVTINYRFTTAMLKGGPNLWAIKGGNAASGSLTTMYSGVRPDSSYNPMQKEGSIILGIGGDNSNWAQGTFHEGVMTSGYPSDATENAVQANIVDAGYAAGSLTSGPVFTVGSAISMRATTPCCTSAYIAHTGSQVNIQVVNSSSSTALKQSASWNVKTGLSNSACFSFESRDTPGNYIRHDNYVLMINNGSAYPNSFNDDATFCPIKGINGQGNSLRSWSYPTHYMRHYEGNGYIAHSGGVHIFDAPYSFNDDISFVMGTNWA
jgi:non-reducing end alpha-L-arabinofuranosidase